MKKLTSHNQMNKIAKSALAIVLAGTFTLSPSLAFATDSTTNTNDLDTVDLQKVMDIDTNAETTVNNEVTEKESQTSAEEAPEKPSLLPGDFFYFTKLAFEKVKLALTFNDMKEAGLLAQYASERLAEAESLFLSGEETLALQSIEEAVNYIQNSDDIVEEESPTDESMEEPIGQESPADETVTVDDKVAEGDQTEGEDSVVVEDEALTNDETAIEEVKNLLSQNIIALTAAMEKVQNPKAKAALQKNIDKSYKKLAKKIQKWEKHYADKIEKEENHVREVVENEDIVSETEITNNVEVDLNEPALDVNLENSTESHTAIPVVVPTEGEKVTKEVVKTERKAAKEEIKQVKEQKKQEIKQQRMVAKQDAKQDKQEMKKAKHENKSKEKH
jgi:hypothetical protein